MLPVQAYTAEVSVQNGPDGVVYRNLVLGDLEGDGTTPVRVPKDFVGDLPPALTVCDFVLRWGTWHKPATSGRTGKAYVEAASTLELVSFKVVRPLLAKAA